MAESFTPEDELFDGALARPPAERRPYLLKACAGDDELFGRVEALLQAHDAAGAFLGEAHLDAVRGRVRKKVAGFPVLREVPGDWVGRYKLLEKIGEGGCGVVYMADQEEPVRRRVAIKVIKLGMDTKAVVGRFEAERQALAMMEHPNIAKVFDAGATETGRPFFAMELVRGMPITKYCDEQKLQTSERLELFMQVCSAVQHAHQKGIIHRDLKPSNILVTLHDGVPVPKVIDFGIAKATLGRLTDSTVFTAFEQFIGTPAYMSPEQAEISGLDIDTRSDIYSLGVLLYELLSGRPPFDPRALVEASLDQIRWIIREQEPPRPSTRLNTLSELERTTVAQQRRLVPAQLALLLKGDLDWIVMRCLEKDRTRRYDTATGLVTDLRRHLANEPVAARPPSTWYYLQKLLRRHRLAFGASLAIAVALFGGTAVSAWQAVRATLAEKLADLRLSDELRAREEAESQRQLAVDRLRNEQAQRLETERQKTLAEQERNRALRAEELAAERLQNELAARQEAEKQKALADAQRSLAEAQRAVAEQERNRALDAEKAAQTESARSAEAVELMRNMLKGAGPHVALVSDPKSLHVILDRIAQRLSGEPEGEPRAELRDALTAVYYDLGDYVTSAALGGKWQGQDHPPLALALNFLGTSLLNHRWTEEAEAVLRQAVAVDRLLSITDTARPESLSLLENHSKALKLAGRAEEAAKLDRESEMRRTKAASISPSTPPEGPK